MPRSERMGNETKEPFYFISIRDDLAIIIDKGKISRWNFHLAFIIHLMKCK
jgi:hypothetical protein